MPLSLLYIFPFIPLISPFLPFFSLPAACWIHTSSPSHPLSLSLIYLSPSLLPLSTRRNPSLALLAALPFSSQTLQCFLSSTTHNIYTHFSLPSSIYQLSHYCCPGDWPDASPTRIKPRSDLICPPAALLRVRAVLLLFYFLSFFLSSRLGSLPCHNSNTCYFYPFFIFGLTDRDRFRPSAFHTPDTQPDRHCLSSLFYFSLSLYCVFYTSSSPRPCWRLICISSGSTSLQPTTSLGSFGLQGNWCHWSALDSNQGERIPKQSQNSLFLSQQSKKEQKIISSAWTSRTVPVTIDSTDFRESGGWS